MQQVVVDTLLSLNSVTQTHKRAEPRQRRSLVERGCVTVVRSVVHDATSTERLLSKCFSQGPPHNRTSSAQAHHLMKGFPGDLALQFSKHVLEKSKTRLGLRPFRTSSVIHCWLLGLTCNCATGNGFARCKDLNTHEKRAQWAEIYIATDFIIRLASSNLFHQSPSIGEKDPRACVHTMHGWSMHYVAQELCVMGSQQGDGLVSPLLPPALAVFSHLKCWEQQLTVARSLEQISEVWHEGSRKTLLTSWCLFCPAQIDWSDPLYQFTSVGGDLRRRRTLSLCIR